MTVPKTFSQFFTQRAAQIARKGKMVIPANEISRKIEERQKNLAEDRELDDFVVAMMGGSRTVRPHPKAVRARKVGNFHISAPARTEIRPRTCTMLSQDMVDRMNAAPAHTPVKAPTHHDYKADLAVLTRKHITELEKALDKARERLADVTR